MDFAQLYTTTTGRINRKTWWLGTIGLFVIIILLSIVLSAFASVLGLTKTAFGNGLISLILLGIMFVPYRAMILKRLHDRDRPEILFWVWIGPQIVISVLTMIGLTGSVQEQAILGQSVEALKYNAFGNLLNFIATGIGIWSLVELGFLKGVVGENVHGAAPLGGGA